MIVINSEGDIFYNFDKWDEGECNIIFVLGPSVSSKSILGKWLAEKYNAQYVDTDKIGGNSNYSDEEMKKEWDCNLSWFLNQKERLS